jgi:hypothetical protein
MAEILKTPAGDTMMPIPGTASIGNLVGYLDQKQVDVPGAPAQDKTNVPANIGQE